VAITWQQNEQSQNARQIVEAAQELYNRVSTFAAHFERIRDGLTKANKAYDEAAGSFERSVRPSGERLVKLGGGSPGKELADVRPLEASLRLPPA
jgi:DNA recombination protein RmuC